MEATTDHPYVPRDLNLAGFVPNSLSQSMILAVFALASIFTVSLVWILSGRLSKISKNERVLMCWWAFTGLTHMILEGYFVFSPEFYKDSSSNYFAEVWKEYAKGDSRYVARDAAVVAVEGVTAVLEGPASLLALYAIARKTSYSYVLQLAICLGQLYGCALYFLTAILEGDNFATSPYFYYAYYVAANASWVVIPTLIAVHCWRQICAAVGSQSRSKAKTR